MAFPLMRYLHLTLESISTRDATFRKMTNRNQIDANEIATTETKNQIDFILPKKNDI